MVIFCGTLGGGGFGGGGGRGGGGGGHVDVIVALLGENSQAGMSMPMKNSFIGMAEVEDIDAVVTLSSAMVGTADKEVMETIELLAHFGITVKTAKEDMDE